MGVRPGTWAALLLVAIGAAPAAPPPREVAVSFGRPEERRSRAAQLCLSSGDVCGGLDEDGLLPLVVHAPKGSMVWVGDHVAAATPRWFVARVDPVELVLDEPISVAAYPGQAREYGLSVRVEGPGLAAERALQLQPAPSFAYTMQRRLLDVGLAPRTWAAAYDAARPGLHPTLVLTRWIKGGRESVTDDVGASEAPRVIFDSMDTKVRDLELVALLRITPKVVERCRRCALGDFAWPEVEFRCARVRLDTEVTVVAARSGQPVATRKFQGPPPGACGDNVSHLEVRGARSPELADWLHHEVARSARP